MLQHLPRASTVLLIAGLFPWLAAAGPPTPATAPPRAEEAARSDEVETCEAVSPAVVTVSVLFARDPGRATDDPLSDAVRIVRPGSGTIVHPQGLVLTNAHLVAEAVAPDGSPVGDHWIVVTLSDGRQLLAEVVAEDQRADLALLRIQPGGERLVALPLGDARELPLGERVLALSFHAGDERNVFAGSLAFPGGPTRLREAVLAAEETLLSDARFHYTLDGGPLVDLRGRLLGVHNSAHVSPPRAPFTEEEEDEGEVLLDTDYAVIVSAAAVRAAFAEHLPDDLPPALVAPDDEQAGPRAVAAVDASVVSVWSGAEEPHPATPDPTDPYSRRVPEGLGSGVVIHPAGLVLTAAALFPEGVERASVRLGSGAAYPAELLARRPEHKAALLRLELPEGVELAAAQLADSRAAFAGERVAVVGRPLEELALSVGVLSALEREGFLQVASWVHRGHLGGALVDRNGRLLGLACDQPAGAGRVEETSYLGFAAPLATLLEAFAAELAPYGPPAPTPYGEADIETRRTAAVRVVERTRSSLVNVLVSAAMPAEASGFNPFGAPEREFALLGQGSGVIVDAGGLAITNWHVVDAAVKPGTEDDHLVEVTLPTGERYVATVLSHSRDDDLALISLQLEPGETLVPVELGDSGALEVGQAVFAIGNPLGLANSVSAGILSCKSLDAQIQGRLRPYFGLLMTDAAINPGNSGGALLDAEARLVGINSAGRVGAGMAIPVDKAREVFSDKLLSAERLRSASFGFRVEERPGGLFVGAIDEDGPAAGSGLEVGDELLGLDGREVSSAVGFAKLQREAQAGEDVALRVGRGGEVVELDIVPVGYAAWRFFRQSGALVEELDYAAETGLVHAASVALHRAYTGDPAGRPSRLMSGALRVVKARSIVQGLEHPLQPGDLLLGVTTYVRGATTDSEHLTRLEDLAELSAAFEPRATKEGQWAECWILRDGEVLEARVWVRRPPQ